MATISLLAVVCLGAVAGCRLLGHARLGTLVAFEALVSFDHPIQAAELSADQEPQDVFSELRDEDLPALPPLGEQTRRFAFIDSGCAHNSAQLVIEEGVLSAQLLEDGSTEQHTDCGGLAWFLSVFDVPADDLPADVQLP